MPTYMYIDDVEAIPPTAIERLNRLTVIIENLIMGESHSQGLSMQQMDALPLVNVTQEQHQQALNCSVCLEDYQLDETVKELPCKVGLFLLLRQIYEKTATIYIILPQIACSDLPLFTIHCLFLARFPSKLYYQLAARS